LELWQKPDAYSPERGTPRAYLVLLTRSRSVDRLRSMRTHAAGGDHTIQHLDRDDPPASAHRDASPQLAAESSELAGIVQHELGQLAENQRALIDLAYFQGLTHEEIAAHTDVPLGTVKGRVRRGLIALRKRLAARLGRQESRESSSSGTSANHDSDEHAKGADA
ncbi:MAG: sigma-70 family RNA polymerase sigma factor, partial [Planctomycetota bacterium]